MRNRAWIQATLGLVVTLIGADRTWADNPEKYANQHPTSTAWWVSATLALNDHISIYQPFSCCHGDVTAINNNEEGTPVATVKISTHGCKTAENPDAYACAHAAGAEIPIGPSNYICGSCLVSGTTAAIGGYPATRTFTVAVGSSTSFRVPPGTFFDTVFNYDAVSVPASGSFMATLGTPDINGISTVSNLDLSGMVMPGFTLLGLQFSDFTMNIVGYNIQVDTTASQENLTGSMFVKHGFKVNGVSFELSDNVGLYGALNAGTGAVEVNAIAGLFGPTTNFIPTVSEWGLGMLALLFGSAGTIVVRRRLRAVA